MEEQTQEEVIIYNSFKDFVSTPDMAEYFRSVPALTYMLYLAGGEISRTAANGKLDCSIKDCLAKVLNDLPMWEGKPSVEDVLTDQDGSVTFNLNDILAPQIILGLVESIETYESTNNKGVLH